LERKPGLAVCSSSDTYAAWVSFRPHQQPQHCTQQRATGWGPAGSRSRGPTERWQKPGPHSLAPTPHPPNHHTHPHHTTTTTRSFDPALPNSSPTNRSAAHPPVERLPIHQVVLLPILPLLLLLLLGGVARAALALNRPKQHVHELPRGGLVPQERPLHAGGLHAKEGFAGCLASSAMQTYSATRLPVECMAPRTPIVGQRLLPYLPCCMQGS
jgi:hypothetical protein